MPRRRVSSRKIKMSQESTTLQESGWTIERNYLNKSFTSLRANAPSFIPKSSRSLDEYSKPPSLLYNNSFTDPLSSFREMVKETDFRLSNDKPNGLVVTEIYQSPEERLEDELKLIYSCGSSIVENSTDRINEIKSILNQ